jgi:hypothetical protein
MVTSVERLALANPWSRDWSEAASRRVLNHIPPPTSDIPVTFQERGVAVSFTTPFLGGTRARRGRGQGIELLVRNPAGGRGIYVMPWSGIMSLCRPTLHDSVLTARIGTLESVTPATIRRVVWAIAAEGLAGELAMQAAQIAMGIDKRDRRETSHQLLVALVHQVDGILNLSAPLPGPDTPDLDARARQTIAWLAPHLHRPATWVVGALEALTDVMSGHGTGDEGRIPRLAGMLREVRTDIAEWSRTQRNAERLACAATICSAADLALAQTEASLAKARVAMKDMIGLLRGWAAEPATIAQIAARPEWLLDGWEQICLIWKYAQDDAARCAALVEIVEHVPIPPREAGDGNAISPESDTQLLRQRPIGLNEDWLTGAVVFDLIARNEQLRAVVS